MVGGEEEEGAGAQKKVMDGCEILRSWAGGRAVGKANDGGSVMGARQAGWARVGEWRTMEDGRGRQRTEGETVRQQRRDGETQVVGAGRGARSRGRALYMSGFGRPLLAVLFALQAMQSRREGLEGVQQGGSADCTTPQSAPGSRMSRPWIGRGPAGAASRTGAGIPL